MDNPILLVKALNSLNPVVLVVIVAAIIFGVFLFLWWKEERIKIEPTLVTKRELEVYLREIRLEILEEVKTWLKDLH